MNYTVDDRAAELGEYIITNNATVRSTAKAFGISKSTVHTDVSQRLKKSDYALYLKVRRVLDENKAQRHIRGGLATKEEYVDMFKKGILDPAKVTRSALQNAASVAAMVLTTESLVTDIPDPQADAAAVAAMAQGGGMY